MSHAHLPKLGPCVAYLLILGGAAVWCGALLVPPLLRSLGGTPADLSAVAYQFFHALCHQDPERSFHLFGYPLAVCMRCSAIYGAFLIGTLLYPLLRSRLAPSPSVLLAAMLPMLIDVGLDWLGVSESTVLSRVVSGALFGCIVPLFIVASAEKAEREWLLRSP